MDFVYIESKFSTAGSTQETSKLVDKTIEIRLAKSIRKFIAMEIVIWLCK